MPLPPHPLHLHLKSHLTLVLPLFPPSSPSPSSIIARPIASILPPPPPPQTRQNVRTDANAQEVAKDNWNPVLIIEPEFKHITNPLSLARSLHPPGWEHPKVETLKTQRFYEFILVDTNSIPVTHSPCSSDPDRIA